MGANTKSISYYEKINDIHSQKTIPLDIFFENIKSKWEDEIHLVRTGKLAKSSLPSVTISGKFKSRYDDKIESHSGYIGMDIDKDDLPEGLNAEEFKAFICPDKYVAAAFITASGEGLCVVFKINPAKHRLAFEGLSEYIFNTYGATCDPTSINESRPRFVSWDPNIYICDHDVEKFAIYPKEKPPKKLEKIIFAQNDFEEILQQVALRRIDLTQSSYYRYLRIGFGLVHQFGEAGRPYFHIICQFSSKYDSSKADRQYNNCLRHKSNNVTTIATLYYYCKEEGIALYSQRTRIIAHTTSSNKKAGLNVYQIAENLAKFEEITDAEEVIQQVYDNDIQLNDDSLLDQLEMFIRQNYDLRRNGVTLFIENKGVPITKEGLNSIFIKCKKVYDKLTFDLMERLIYSDFIVDYNPFFEFINENIERGTNPDTPAIKAFFGSIKNMDPNYCLYFGRKWLVGLISAIHGVHSPLVLVLCGDKQGTGKTEFFRRMLPSPLKKWYAESKLDAGKDDYILMTKKLIVMDDEMGGKSKKESKLLKDITSKQVFTLREPYGHHNVDLNRLAGLCGTTNDFEIIGDVNRRIIPVMVQDVDFAAYNAVDKTELFMEAYHLYKSGFEWQVLGDDINYLRQDQGMFEIKNMEAELLLKYFEPAGQGLDATYDLLTSTDIKVYLENRTNQRLSLTVIGKELQRLGFRQVHQKIATTTRRVYEIVYKQNNDKNDQPF